MKVDFARIAQVEQVARNMQAEHQEEAVAAYTWVVALRVELSHTQDFHTLEPLAHTLAVALAPAPSHVSPAYCPPA